MPFVPILIALLAVGLIVLGLVGWRVRGSVQRFRMVSELAQGHTTDRSGMLKARSAALGVAMSDLRQHPLGHSSARDVPRTIGSSVEREDHRA